LPYNFLLLRNNARREKYEKSPNVYQDMSGKVLKASGDLLDKTKRALESVGDPVGKAQRVAGSH
jgi:hypothetical protein